MSTRRIISVPASRIAMRALLCCGAALALCGGTAGAQSLSAGNTAPIAAAGPWVAPERAARQTNPVASNAESVNRGHSVFSKECEKCHGKAGHGDGPQAAYLSTKPADLAELVSAQSDGSLFYKITEGRGQMPKAKINDNDKWAVIDYLRTLSAKK